MGNNINSTFPREEIHQNPSNRWIDLNTELPENNIIDLATEHNDNQIKIDIPTNYPYTYHIINNPSINQRKYLIQCSKCKLNWVDNELSVCTKCKSSNELELIGDDIVPASSRKTCSSFVHSLISKCNVKCKSKDNKKKIELSSVNIAINKKSVSDNHNSINNNELLSIDEEAQIYSIVSSHLIPFLQSHKILIKTNTIFHINNYTFKVISTLPSIPFSSYNYGYISSKTNIHCDSFYSNTTQLTRVFLITTTKYKNFTESHFQTAISSISAQKLLQTHRNSIIEINNDKFYTRNCTPEYGIITPSTSISIDNKLPLQIAKVKCAVLNTSLSQISLANLTNSYFRPYFLDGIERYIEQGDTFKIGHIDVFVLQCQPQSGFVVKNTLIRYKFGKTRNQCIAYIQREDNKIASEMNARNVMNRYRTLTSILREFMVTTHNEIINERINQQRRIRRIVSSLPTVDVDEKFLERISLNEDEMNKKCVICMEKYTLNENVKTLPCCKLLLYLLMCSIVHIFHTQCVDEWLNGKDNCPICKCKVDINTNIGNDN